MKKIQVILLSILFIGCHPSYEIFVENKFIKEVHLSTEPSMESLLMPKSGSYYDSIVFKKINHSDSIGIYRLKPDERMSLYGYMGRPSSSDYFPYKSVKIIKEEDTIEVNKENILDKITREEKRFYSGTYYIEVY